MMTPAHPSCDGYRFPAEIISHAVWLYFRFPLSLRMVDELLAKRSIMRRPLRAAALWFRHRAPARALPR